MKHQFQTQKISQQAIFNFKILKLDFKTNIIFIKIREPTTDLQLHYLLHLSDEYQRVWFIILIPQLYFTHKLYLNVALKSLSHFLNTICRCLKYDSQKHFIE